jgi:hypothetical protein
VEKEGALMSLRGAAPVFWISADPKAASKPTTPVARMTDRNNGAGTVESGRGFIIPASKGCIGSGLHSQECGRR